MLDPRQLEALITVAAEGSVARAAQNLGWSQPTVDYHLRALDTLVGTPLVVRSSRGTSLTPAGQLMCERAHELMAVSVRAVSDVREFSRLDRPKIRFGCFPTAAARLLPGIAERLAATGIEMNAALAEVAPLVQNINTHALDAAIVYVAHGHSLRFRAGVATTLLCTDPLLLALPRNHPAAARTSLTVAEVTALHDLPWVFGATPGDTLDEVVREAFAAAGAPFDIAVRTDDYAVSLSLVAAGLGTGLVPQFAAVNAPAGVVLRRIDDDRFARDLVLSTVASSVATPSVLRRVTEAVRRSLLDVTEAEL